MENPWSTTPSPYCHNYTLTDPVWNRHAEIQANCVPAPPTLGKSTAFTSPLKFLHATAFPLHEPALERRRPPARRRRRRAACEPFPVPSRGLALTAATFAC